MDYPKHYDTLIDRARTLILDSYTERHHIIPRCIGGGTNDSINLVNLTPEEHYVAHQLLIKIYPNEPKLVVAARYMCYGNKLNGGRTNNKMFGWLRRAHSEAMSIITAGRIKTQETIDKRSNSNRGKKRTEETKERMYVSQKGKMGIPLTDEAKEKMGANVSNALKGRTWEDLYGIEGSAKRRELAAIRKQERTNKKESQ